MRAGLGGIALNEGQLKGYRVRLRVVEEYDVALLAESPDDAKARAEADLRRGDQFEDIQDSWPEDRLGRSAGCGAVPGTRIDGAAAALKPKRRIQLL